MTTRRPRPGVARRLGLERMEDRAVPASLAIVDVNLDGSDMRLTYTADPGESNVLTVTVSGGNYVFNDPLPGGITAPGMTGDGTPTVSVPASAVDSIAIDLGDGADVLNLRSAADDLTVTSSGDLAVNLSSNAPANTGTVAGILGNVTVAGSGGTNSLVIGNAGGAGVTTTIAHNQVADVLPGGKDVNFTGIGSLRVSTSNTAADAVTVAVASGSMAVRVDTNGGADTIAVEATAGATAVNAGAGNDIITVGDATNGLDDVAGGLTIDAGAGAANSLTVTDFALAGANTVAVSASQITGFAPAVITYRAVGGAYGAGGGITLQGSDAAADAITLGGALAAHLFAVNGNGGNDTLAVAGNVRAALHGGADDDTFVLGTDGAVLTGAVDGGAGSNTLSYAGRTTTVNLTMTGAAAGTGTGTTGGFGNIAALVGGGGPNGLTGADVANTWSLTGTNAGSIAGGPSFSGFQTLTGGSDDDTFVFGAVAGDVTGSIGGGAGGADTLDYSAVAGTVGVTLTGSNSGSASRISGVFGGMDTLVGNATTSTLTGRNAANSWTVGGTDAGSIAGGPVFSGFNNLTGGSDDDTFNYTAGTGKSTGTVSGGGGTTDSVHFAGYAGGVTVDLQALAATKSSGGASVINALSGINDYQGTAGGGDVLVGPNAARTWTVNAADGGTVGTVGFGGFENLSGGTAADTFAFTDAGSLSGVLAGGSGTDTLDLSARTGAVAVTLASAFAGSTAPVSGGFGGIEAHTGNGAQSTLTGYSVAGGGPVANTWTVTGTDSGSLTDGSNPTGFAGYANLAGGAGDDTFVYAGGGAGKTTGGVAAGAGSLGSLQFQGYTGGVTVDLQSAAAAKTTGGASVVAGFTGINDIESDAASGDTLVGPDAITTWAVSGANAGTVGGAVAFRAMENLKGGSAADAFAFGAGGSVAGAADGGAGANSIDYSATAGVKSVTFTGLGSAAGFDGTGNLITGGFRNVSAITANAATTNALTGRNAAATWTIDDTAGDATYASGGRTFSLAGFQVLTGGGMTDTFNVLSTGSGRIWTLKGGAGDDVFALSHLDDQLGVLTLAGGAGSGDTIAIDDSDNGNAASWAVAAGNVSRGGVSIDYSGFEHADVTTGTGAVAVLIESTGVGQTLTVNAGGSKNDISVGLISNRYDLAAGVTVNLTNSGSTDSLTIDDTAAAPGPVEWSLTQNTVARLGAGTISLIGTMESVSVTAGDGGVTGNTFDVTASASTAFVVSGGAGSADALTVHDAATVGTDDGVSEVTFTGGLQAVCYYDFDLTPVVVD